MFLITRLWVILIALLLGFILFIYIFKPTLKNLCLLDSQNCIQIEYKQYLNSVLIHLLKQGIWLWYDGRDILVYGLPAGRQCTDKGYESAYVIQKDKVIGWTCAKSLDIIKEFYENETTQYIFISNPSPKFNVYDVINYLSDKRIINLDKTIECTSSSDCGPNSICVNGTCNISFQPKLCKTDTDCKGDVCRDGYCVGLTECEKYLPDIHPKQGSECFNANDFITFTNSSLKVVPDKGLYIVGSPFQNVSVDTCNKKCKDDPSCVLWHHSNNVCQAWKLNDTIKGGITDDNIISLKGNNIGIFKTLIKDNMRCSMNRDCTAPEVCKDNICAKMKEGEIINCNMNDECSRGMKCDGGKCSILN